MSITKHGVTFEDAYTEAAAVAYAGRAMLNCYSIEHPLLPEIIYFVDDRQDFVAMVPGVTDPVTFEACKVRTGRPEESDQAATPQIRLEVDNITGAISDLLDIIRGSPQYTCIVTNYLYASDNTTAPVVTPPEVMEVTSASYDENSAVLSGSFGDAGNRAIPRLTFKRSFYPALSRMS